MCIVVDYHERFEASVHEVESTIPNVREYTDGLKWRLEHGEERGEYVERIDAYVLTYEIGVQVYYCVNDKPGEPRRITILTARIRPDP